MPDPKIRQPRIVLVAGIILIAVTLLAGVSVFAVMQRNAEEFLDKSLQSSLHSRIELTKFEIQVGFDRTVLISTRPLMTDQLQIVDARADDTDAQNKLTKVAGSFLQNGLTAIALYGESGRELTRVGIFVQQPELAVTLNNLPGDVQLLWDGQLLLHAVVEIKREGRVIGKVMTELPLPATMGTIKDANRLGKTGEQALCAPFGLKMQCFPTTLNPKVLTVSKKSPQGVPLPMTYALEGETGFITAIDYRNQEVVAAFEPVGDLGLGMVLKMDSAELYAPVWNQLRFLIPLLAGVLIIVLLLLRWRLTPLVRRLVRSEAEARSMASIIESSSDAITSTSLDGVITSWNPAAERMYGYSAEEIIGQSILLISPPENTHEVADILRKIRDGHKVEPYETLQIRKDGSSFPISLTLSPIYDESGLVIGESGIARDITREKEASQNARNMASIVASSNDAITSSGLEGIFTSWNAAAERMYGYLAKEMIGQPFWCLIVPENVAALGEIMEKVGNDRKVESYETVHIRKNGSTFPILMTISPIHDESGAVIGASSIARDITREKEASQNARNMASIVASSNDAITSSGLEGIFTSWNPAAERMYGYSAEEMIGQPFSRLTPPENTQEDPDNQSKIRDGYTVEPYETLRIRKDGSTIPISLTISPIYDESGVVIGSSGIARDITAEREAFGYARKMASLIESSNDSITSVDLEGTITSWNMAAEHIYGYTAKEIIGQPASLLIPPENTHELADMQSKIRDGSKIEPYETLRIRKDGSTIPISLTISPIRDESGVAVGASAIARDITADKQIIRQLEEMNVLRSEFVAIVAHDLRAPMASISGFAHLLIDEWSDTNDGEKIEYLQIIARNTENLANFVEDVLQVARMEAGEYTYDIGSFDARVLAQRALDEAIGPNNDRRFELIAPDSLPLVLGDEERQWQVLTNLLSNALKFSPAPEPITVELSNIEGFVRVGVIDRGIGIAEEDLPKLFRKSGRLVKLGNPITPGNGLGLFIAKTLVEAQGGRIWCESAPGVGSTFFFTIPVAR